MNKKNLNKFTILAGAGSGKTYTLSRRYINVLLGFDYFREDYTTQKNQLVQIKNIIGFEIFKDIYRRCNHAGILV
jgi:ATP-dependent exoDNAse (exonuclease V) beta subunit